MFSVPARFLFCGRIEKSFIFYSFFFPFLFFLYNFYYLFFYSSKNKTTNTSPMATLFCQNWWWRKPLTKTATLATKTAERHDRTMKNKNINSDILPAACEKTSPSLREINRNSTTVIFMRHSFGCSIKFRPIHVRWQCRYIHYKWLVGKARNPDCVRVFVHPEFSIEFGRDLASTFYCQDWCKIATKLTIKMSLLYQNVFRCGVSAEIFSTNI